MPNKSHLHHLKSKIWLVAGLFVTLIGLFVWSVTMPQLLPGRLAVPVVLIGFLVLGMLMLATLWSIYQSLQNTLGASVNQLHSRITELGSGDFATPIAVPRDLDNSILGWLSQMQINLKRLELGRTHAEQALASTSQRLANIINATQVGTWERNILNTTLLINERWASMLGYSLAELEPVSVDTFLRLIHPDDLERTEILKELHFQGQFPVYECKFRMQHRDGHWVWILSRGSLLSRDVQGMPEWMAGSHLDISAIEEANDRLRENEHQLRMMLNEMPIGIALVDEHERILFLNRCLIDLVGYTSIDLPKMEQWWTLIFPDPAYRERVKLVWNEALRQSPTSWHLIPANICSVTTASGAIRQIEIAGITTTAGFLATFVDQTETLRNQAQLEEAKELAESTSIRLAKTTEVAELGIWERDLVDQSYIWDRRMFEIYEIGGDQPGLTLNYDYWRSRVHPDDIDRVDQKYAQALRGEGNYDPIFRIIRKDGSTRIIQAVSHIMRNKRGEPLKILGINRDITAQQALESSLRIAKSEAEAATLAKSAFLATMSHEIRTPMNGMLGMIKLLTHTGLTPQQRDYAAKAEHATRALLDIINDILDFSKIEAGKLELETGPLVLTEMLRDLSIVLSASLGNHALEVLIAHDPQIPQVLIGDGLRLRQVLLNLTGNAIKFTPKGEVILSLTQLRRHTGLAGSDLVEIEFAVHDTGIGIAPDHLNQVFESFNQAESSTARRFGGTGLGLAISKQLVALMGGTLSVTSELGHGSRFSFTLTMAAAETSANPPTLNALPFDPHVLILDANAASRQLLTTICEELGWISECVPDDQTALAYLEHNGDINLVLLDWRLLPGAADWLMLRQLRNRPRARGLVVIVMITTHGLELLNQHPNENNGRLIDGYVFKPLTAAMLQDAVFGAVQNHQPSSAMAQIPATSMLLAGLRILVVEDNALNQQIAKELLELHGASVELANNGISGVEQALAGTPALILMDIQMPDIDGLEATRRLRQHPAMRDTPIIAMTANAMHSDQVSCLAAGMNDHVAKPIDLDLLLRTILKHASSSVTLPRPAQRSLNRTAAIGGTPLVDVELAIRRIGGSHDFYARLVQAAQIEGPQQLSHCQSLLAQGDLSGAMRALHTFKGLLATLGAQSLAALAGSIEKHMGELLPAGRASGLTLSDEQAITLLPAQIAAAEKILQQVIEELRDHPMLRAPVQSLPLTTVAAEPDMPAAQRLLLMSTDLDELTSYLESNNMRSIACFTRIRSGYANWLTMAQLDLLRGMESAIHELKFAQAAALCRQLSQEIEP